LVGFEKNYALKIRIIYTIEVACTDMKLYNWVIGIERGDLWGDNRRFGLLLQELMAARGLRASGPSTGCWKTDL
jgi:hypothetical protein